MTSEAGLSGSVGWINYGAVGLIAISGIFFAFDPFFAS